jgi:hypothetical protein
VPRTTVSEIGGRGGDFGDLGGVIGILVSISFELERCTGGGGDVAISVAGGGLIGRSAATPECEAWNTFWWLCAFSTPSNEALGGTGSIVGDCGVLYVLFGLLGDAMALGLISVCGNPAIR